mgnify:CR=1 FL=1
MCDAGEGYQWLLVLCNIEGHYGLFWPVEVVGKIGDKDIFFPIVDESAQPKFTHIGEIKNWLFMMCV